MSSPSQPRPARLTPEQLSRIKSVKPTGFTKVERVLIPKDGSITGYIIPGTWGAEKMWYLPIGTHYVEAVAKYPLNCPRVNIGEDQSCPLCEIFFEEKKTNVKPRKEYVDKLKASGASKAEIADAEADLKASDDYASQFRARTAFAVNFLLQGETKAKLFEIPNKAFTTVFSSWQDGATKYGIDMFDPNCAYAVTIAKSGAGLNTKYNATLAPIGNPIVPSKQDEGLLDEKGYAALLESCLDLDTQYSEIKPDLLAKAASVLTAAGVPEEAAPAAEKVVSDNAPKAPVTGIKMDPAVLARVTRITPKVDEDDAPAAAAPVAQPDPAAPADAAPAAEAPAPVVAAATPAGGKPNPFTAKLQRLGQGTPAA